MVNLVLAREGFVALQGVVAPSGVYLLLVRGEVVYVGQSENVYQRFTSHYNAKVRGYRKKRPRFLNSQLSPYDIRIMPIPFDSVLVRWLPKAELDKAEAALIARFKPKYNVIEPSRLPDVKVDLKSLVDTLGFEHWMKPLPNSSPSFRRRKVA